MASIFIQGGSGETSSYDQNDLTATAKDVVVNYTYIGADTDTDVVSNSVGSMPTTSSIAQTISNTLSIPKGYLLNDSIVKCTALVNLLSAAQKGTATANFIKKNKKAYINGVLTTGTMTSLFW